jgi:hypothetical protein
LWLPGLPLSLPRHPFGHEDSDGRGGMHHRKASAMSNAALISAGDTRRFLVAAAVNHCNDTVRYRRAERQI